MRSRYVYGLIALGCALLCSYFVPTGAAWGRFLKARPESAAGPQEESFTFAGKTGKFTLWQQPGLGVKPGLLLFIHGSGATDSYAAPIAQLQEFGKTYDLLIVAVQAPDHATTWPNGNPAQDNRHTAYLKALIAEKLAPAHPFDPNRVYFVGMSAGSTFLTGDFLPEAGPSFTGGMVLLCGGAAPFFPLDKTRADQLRNQLKLYYRIDSSDFLYGQATGAISYYSRLGVRTFTDITHKGGGHCGFDFATALKAALDKIDTARHL